MACSCKVVTLVPNSEHLVRDFVKTFPVSAQDGIETNLARIINQIANFRAFIHFCSKKCSGSCVLCGKDFHVARHNHICVTFLDQDFCLCNEHGARLVLPRSMCFISYAIEINDYRISQSFHQPSKMGTKPLLHDLIETFVKSQLAKCGDLSEEECCSSANLVVSLFGV